MLGQLHRDKIGMAEYPTAPQNTGDWVIRSEVAKCHLNGTQRVEHDSAAAWPSVYNGTRLTRGLHTEKKHTENDT